VIVWVGRGADVRAELLHICAEERFAFFYLLKKKRLELVQLSGGVHA
jgi:hypothetical protein